MLACVLALSLSAPAFAAKDEATRAADTLYSLGLFSGTGTNADGTPVYDLERSPTRQEAITMLVGLLGKKEEALAGSWDIPFTDVADWAKPFVGYAYANGLTSGTSATTFGGNDLVSAAQYLTFVLKVLGYEAGTHFQWDKAWELSDKIGLTDGRYSGETKTFTRGDVAIISRNALSVNQKGTVISLARKLEEEKAGGYRAWFYVDDMGALSIQTNIDSSQWDGYAIAIVWKQMGYSWYIDTQSGHGKNVEYNCTSTLSSIDEEVVVNNPELYVFRGSESREIFWDHFEAMNSQQKAAEALGEQFVCRIDLNTTLRCEKKYNAFQLTDLTITVDEAAETETYVARIDGGIRAEGDYGLCYIGNMGGSMSYIGRGDGVLTFTRESGHFTRAGNTGTFWITHCTHSINEKNEIVCTESLSTPLDYEFK